MKFVSWNVNGLRACEGKGFSDVFRSLDADFFCLQETKMQAGQLDLQFDGYQSYWNYADKKVPAKSRRWIPRYCTTEKLNAFSASSIAMRADTWSASCVRSSPCFSDSR